jgi:hypothetical protein
MPKRELARAAVTIAEQDDVIARLQQGEDRAGRGGHAARKRHGVLGTFESSQPRLELVHGRVAVAPVLPAMRVRILAAHVAFERRRVLVGVGGGLCDAVRQSVVRPILRRACMDGGGGVRGTWRFR